MQKNTPELWDKLWKDTSELEDRYNVIKEEKGLRWQRIERLVNSKFGCFKGLRIIEVGAGAGTNAILFAKRGSKITILDYSKKAIERSKEFFRRNGCKADFILADALDIPNKFMGKYDIAMSFGLAEHFTGSDRIKIIKAHSDLINETGIIIISVPNKHNPPYRIYKFMAQLLGFWKFGEEYPYSRGEFIRICRKINLQIVTFLGDSFWESFRFINPFRLFKKKNVANIKPEKSSFLDSHYAYSLVLAASYKPTKQSWN